jgi:hypothetical protein
LSPAQALAEYSLARRIYSVDLENVLGQIDTDRRNGLHWILPKSDVQDVIFLPDAVLQRRDGSMPLGQVQV